MSLSHLRLPVVVGLSLLAAACGHAAPRTSASQLLRTALADATASGSVHEASTEVLGSRRATFSDDVATGSGRQDITVSGGIHAHVRVTGQTAYISGDAHTLAKYFGLSPAAARFVGTRWVSIPSSSADYATVAEDATLSSALGEITPSGPLTFQATTKIDGEDVIGIRGGLPSSLSQIGAGTVSGTATVYLTRSSRPLPVYAALTASSAAAGTATFTSTLTGWAERGSTTAPARSIPIGRLLS